LRSDNADFRLMDYGYRFGLIPKDIYEKMRSQRDAIAAEIKRLKATFVSLPEGSLNLARYLRRPEITYRDIEKIERRGRIHPTRVGEGLRPLPLNVRVKEAVEIELKYEGYLEQDRVLAERLAKNAKSVIPKGFNYDKIVGLSSEAREKLKKFRPGSLDEARQISGIRASDLTLLFLRLHG
jgi:tRNA uridine 5-carboxymethylaminomethyl modification enzyme